ncbi:MAG TPA: hypothetical protein VGG99_19655 [Acetobacteraceae bacterium]
MNLAGGILLAMFLGVLPGMIAQRKGRCFVDWWLYGMALFAVALTHSLLLRPQQTRCIHKGVFLLATGQREGLEYFSGATPHFLASLASLAIWPLVGVVALLTGSGGPDAVSDVLASVCAVLAPPVLSYELAARWDRAAQWARYATAFNWCQWALPVVAAILVTFIGVLDRGGLSSRVAFALLVCAFSAYGLWLHWFVAVRGLELSRLRAAVLVVAINLITVLLVLLPRVLMLERS